MTVTVMMTTLAHAQATLKMKQRPKVWYKHLQSRVESDQHFGRKPASVFTVKVTAARAKLGCLTLSETYPTKYQLVGTEQNG